MSKLDTYLLTFASLLALLLIFRAPPPESREALLMIVGGVFALVQRGARG